jgi:hypothetical protein
MDVRTICIIQQWAAYTVQILEHNITEQENARNGTIQLPNQILPHFIEIPTSNSFVIYKFAGKNDQQESHAKFVQRLLKEQHKYGHPTKGYTGIGQTPLLAGKLFLTIFHQQPLCRDTWSAAVRLDKSMPP